MQPRRVPLFAGAALAAQVERAEAEMIAAGTEAAARRDPGGGAFVLPLGGGFACWAGPGSPLDKVVGVGFSGGPVTDRELEAVERACFERETAVQFELSTLADPTLAARLTRRGYHLVGFENVLARPLERPDAEAVPPGELSIPPIASEPIISEPASAPEISVAACGAEDQALWLDVVVTGFAHPDTQGIASHEEFPREVLERVISDLVSGSGFRRYLARRDGTPAGGASLRIADRVALLCGASTLPAHRRHGVQSALLGHRLAEATAAGCQLAVVTTQPGSKSQQNVQRQGFELIYARAVLVREPS